MIKGDVVKLKKGGLTMTVQRISNSGIECVWFDDKKLNVQVFNELALINCAP